MSSPADPPGDDDRAAARFLDFLAADMAKNPHRLRPFDADLLREIEELVDGVEIDLDAPLPPDDTPDTHPE